MCVCVQRLWLYMKTAPKLSQTRCHAAAPIRLPVIRKLGIMEVVQPDRSSSRLRKMATGSQFVREKGPNRKSKWAGVQVAAAAPTHEAKQAPVFLTFITLMNLVETFQKCRVKHDPSFCSPGETSSRCRYFSSDFTPCGFQIITEAVCLFFGKVELFTAFGLLALLSSHPLSYIFSNLMMSWQNNRGGWFHHLVVLVSRWDKSL